MVLRLLDSDERYRSKETESVLIVVLPSLTCSVSSISLIPTRPSASSTVASCSSEKGSLTSRNAYTFFEKRPSTVISFWIYGTVRFTVRTCHQANLRTQKPCASQKHSRPQWSSTYLCVMVHYEVKRKVGDSSTDIRRWWGTALDHSSDSCRLPWHSPSNERNRHAASGTQEAAEPVLSKSTSWIQSRYLAYMRD